MNSSTTFVFVHLLVTIMCGGSRRRETDLDFHEMIFHNVNKSQNKKENIIAKES